MQAMAVLRLTVAELNGVPALVAWAERHGGAAAVLDVRDGAVTAVRSVLSPEKLTYLGRQLSHPAPAGS